ncbi:hypothetical protein I3U59_24165 [Mycobacteroides abscessus subsp. abscessus]|nr:hypothetical protein [Mycobacteroides abscessus subsp. abscessus]
MSTSCQLQFDQTDIFDEESAAPISASPASVHVGGREFHPSPVFDTYWRFAARRQEIYEARIAGKNKPWTTDPILQSHRFTNCFRAADRVSQYLIRNVLYIGDQSPAEIVFRTILFKLFNKIETWELLTAAVGAPTLATFDTARYGQVFDEAFARDVHLYSAAYVMPSPAFGATRKHHNHLRLLEHMMASDLAGQLAAAGTMQSAFEMLRAYPGLGDFLALQYLIDINYSTAMNFSEMDFVVPGPGARDGIRKCFGPDSAGHEADLIRYMAESQDGHFARLRLGFNGLFGRPLQLIDCQNLFCEVGKYARVAHPQIPGYSGRTRIKQKYRPIMAPLSAWFPPKWGLNTTHFG